LQVPNPQVTKLQPFTQAVAPNSGWQVFALLAQSLAHEATHVPLLGQFTAPLQLLPQLPTQVLVATHSRFAPKQLLQPVTQERLPGQ
jgi:hypothetical protein